MSILIDFLNEQAKKKKDSPRARIEELSKNAGQCILCTHVGKFTDPSVRGVNACAGYNPKDDGYIYTENVEHGLDAAINNAKFITSGILLMKRLEDGRSFFEHIEDGDADVVEDIRSIGADVDMVRANVLKAKRSDNKGNTDNKIRQVYFPVENSDHLLSVIAPSSVMEVVYSEITKAERAYFAAHTKDDEEHYRQPHKEILGTTMVGIGGEHPKNVSALNQEHSGVWFMLDAQPPKLRKREFVHPRTDFFANTLYVKRFRQLFEKAHNLYLIKYNNVKIQEKVAEAELDVIDEVLFIAAKAQALPEGWTENTKLPKCQRIWLDNARTQARTADKEWESEVSLSFARWYISTYKKIIGKKALEMGDAELDNLQGLFLNVLKER